MIGSECGPLCVNGRPAADRAGLRDVAAMQCRAVRSGEAPERRGSGGRMVVDLLCGMERSLTEVMRGYEKNTWMFLGR